MKNNMRYFSMFSGIGGFEYGIQQAFNSHGQQQRDQKASGEGSCLCPKGEQSDQSEEWGDNTCVGYSEIDKYAIKVYERNFNESCDEYAHIGKESEPKERTQGRKRATDKQGLLLHPRDGSAPLCNKCKGHTNYGDATKINAEELPDFDLLVGGFPCQAFSVAGKRAGFDDTRGTLFFDIARILKEKRPRHLVLENVKGLLSHDQGRTFTTIIGVLTDLGYCVEWQVLNSKNFGVPQNRERVFIIGHLRGECSRKIFPLGERNAGSTESDGEAPQANIARTIDTRVGSFPKWGQYIKQINQPKHSNDRVYDPEGLNPTLNTMQGGNRQPFIAAQRGRENGQQLEESKGSYTNTITSVSKDNYVVDQPRIRRLTPKECERLQGFPDDWTAGESDTQRYKMCGNAVTTNVVQAVIEGLLSEED